MGRLKVDIKKIENSTRSQITFSKRRNGLIKKVKELSVLCDIDVAVIAFSPSGRLTQFPNQKRLADVLNRYNGLPVNMRDYEIDDPKPLLQQLDHIYDHGTKTIFVNNQIKRYENQIIISKLELQILEMQLRSFDRNLLPQVTTLGEIRWQETYLMDLLKQLMKRKEILFHKLKMVAPSNIQMGTTRIVANNLISMNVDRWPNPYGFQRNSCGSSSLNEAMGLPVYHNYQDVKNVPRSPLVSNLPTWNRFGSQFQPIQKETAYNGVTPLVPNQQLKIMANSGPVVGDVRLAAGQPTGWTPGMHVQSLHGQEDDDASPVFDPEEVKWLTNDFLNNDQNLHVSEPLISPSVPPSSIYNPTDANLHVDPFLRVYDLNSNNVPNNNNNNNKRDGVNSSSISVLQDKDMSNQEHPWVEFQASLDSTDLSVVQMQNQEDLGFGLQESSSCDLPIDSLQFHDIPIEDIAWDDILNTPGNQDEGTSRIQELNIPDIMINLEDLGIYSE